MAYSSVVDVQISINAVALSQLGFGTPMFMASHGNADNRVIEISDASQLLTDYNFESTDSAYLAAVQFFRNSPSVSTVKIGRIASSQTVTVQNVDSASTSELYTVNIVDASGNTLYTATYTSAGAESDAIVAAGIVQAFTDNYVDIADDYTITVSSNVITVVPVDYDKAFSLTTSTNAAVGDLNVGSYTRLETGAEALAAIRDEDDDFYFVTCEVRPSSTAGKTFCQSLATAIEAGGTSSDNQPANKLYFTSSAAEEDLNGDEGSFFEWAASNGYNRTITLYHQYGAQGSIIEDDIPQALPECYFAGYNAPYDAGSVTWSNLTVDLPASTQPSSSKALTYTQKSTLSNNTNANFVETDSGLEILRTGQTASGEWIDVMRGVDWLTSDLTSSLKSLLFGQKGGKVQYNDDGIARVREVCQTSLQRAVNRNFLDSYTLTVPLVSNVSTTDWVARVLSDLSFTGILTGAIHTVSISGSVTTPTS